MTISVDDLAPVNGKFPQIWDGSISKGGVVAVDDGTFAAVINDGPSKTTILKGYDTLKEASDARTAFKAEMRTRPVIDLKKFTDNGSGARHAGPGKYETYTIVDG